MICSECHATVKGNLEMGWEIICWRCVDKRVSKIEQMEREANMEILFMQDYYEAIAILLDKQQRTASPLLKYARQQAGLSLRLLALKLGCSAGYLADMESGRRLLNTKALQFIRSQDVSTYVPPKICEQNAIDSKQVTELKNGGQRPLEPVLADLPVCWRCSRCRTVNAPTDTRCGCCEPE